MGTRLRQRRQEEEVESQFASDNYGTGSIMFNEGIKSLLSQQYAPFTAADQQKTTICCLHDHAGRPVFGDDAGRRMPLKRSEL
jgi:hypothetical protein